MTDTSKAEQKLREKIVIILDACVDDYYRKNNPVEDIADKILALTDTYYKEKYKGYVKLEDIIEGKIEVLGDGTILDLRRIKRDYPKRTGGK